MEDREHEYLMSVQDELSAHNDAAQEAHHMEQEEAQAKAEGFCIHCGEDIDKCTGYQCWLR